MGECPNCGAKVSSTDKRCSRCGRELKNNSNKLMIGIVIAVILVAVGGIFATGILSDNTSNEVAVVNNTDSSDTSPSTTSTDNASSSTASQEDTDSAGTEYWASSKSDKFHVPSCEWAQKIKSSNKIVYHSRDEAIADGRVPCGVCSP